VLLVEHVGRHESTSAAAEEGTRAHELGEMTAAFVFGKISLKEFHVWKEDWVHRNGLSDDTVAEMTRHIDGYVELIKERMALHPYSQLELEQSLPSGIDGCWGTSDAVIVSPVHVEVIDLKYGKGIEVFAANNPQLKLYGLGALDTYGDVLGETETVTLTIYQPRMGGVSSETLTADELRAWREEIRPVAAEALAPGARFAPSESACKWCPVAGECKARLEYATAEDFGTDPDLVSPAELAEALAKLSMIRSWCDAVQDTALRKAYSEGTEIPGWKVVLSGGRRTINDAAAAVQTLIDKGYAAEQVAQLNIKGIGVLEKLIPDLDETLGSLMSRTPGRPSIVPADDPRPPVSPESAAIKEFSN
jgi:hypothetical protein